MVIDINEISKELLELEENVSKFFNTASNPTELSICYWLVDLAAEEYDIFDNTAFETTREAPSTNADKISDTVEKFMSTLKFFIEECFTADEVVTVKENLNSITNRVKSLDLKEKLVEIKEVLSK